MYWIKWNEISGKILGSQLNGTYLFNDTLMSRKVISTYRFRLEKFWAFGSNIYKQYVELAYNL